MTELYFKELSYKIVGGVFSVYNELGYGYQEKYYYRAIKNKLLSFDLKVQEQLLASLEAEGRIIGRYFLDFLINDCIVLEIKVANQIYPKHIKQVLGYLKAKNLKLGIITCFTQHGIITKRIVN